MKKLMGSATGWTALAAALLALPSVAGAAQVVSVAGDQIIGQWTNPVLIGQLIDGETRQPLGVNNVSGSAVYDLGSLGQAAAITWGDNPGAATPPPPSSTITFTGGIIPDDGTKGTVPFSLGAIAYTNGSSVNGSQIYGATLNLYAVDGANDIPLGSIAVAFTATTNDGTGTAQQQLVEDADYVNFAGTNVSFNVYEGSTALASLNGVIIGDPMASDLSLTIDPDQGANGFIANDSAAGVPEPATWAMMLAGFGAMGAAMRRNRQRRAALV